MTEGIEDLSVLPTPSIGSASPNSSAVDTGQVPKETPEETEAAAESGEEQAQGTAEGVPDCDREYPEALGIVPLPRTCCVCIEMEHINSCMHSEKICILPILACLLSLALCTAGLKWVFVDKIFEYEQPTHLDPKRIGQDAIIISVDTTLGITVSIPYSSPSMVFSNTVNTITQGHQGGLLEDKSTRHPYLPQSPQVTQSDLSVTLKYNAEHTTSPKQTPPAWTKQESNDIPSISSTSTTTTAKTSSHVTRCSDSQRNYCVNGGECFTLEVMPGSTKFLCRCPNEFTGDRCQNYVMASFYKTEELYQKRILTITGICMALLVVGIMCVVAYCKTKKQRRMLHDHLRQNLRNKRNNITSNGIGSNLTSSSKGNQISNLPLQDLQHINQCNGSLLHAAKKKSETVFSTTKYAFSGHEVTKFSHISSPRSTCLSAVSQTSLETSGSPPSERSAPLSSLTISVPSIALSPSGEEERPLLISNPCQPHKSSRQDDAKGTTVHYNDNHMADSYPPSPLVTMANGHDQITTAASHIFSAISEKLLNINNNISDCSSKGVTTDRKLNGDSMLCETKKLQRENTPFFTTDSTAALLLRVMYSSRTIVTPPNDELQVKSSSTTTNKHDLIAV